MPQYQSFDIMGFHSCDLNVGLKLLNGQTELIPSENTWDWLGPGSCFWEYDPLRALQYATENAQGKQKNKLPAKVPFVIGAVIEPGNCLNLVESTSLKILNEAYFGLLGLMEESGQSIPVNSGNNRALDCAVINYIHKTNINNGEPPYDSIRCAFPEGEEAYPGDMITSRLHIQICVCNTDCIKGYFLPKPISKYNPNLPGLDSK